MPYVKRRLPERHCGRCEAKATHLVTTSDGTFVGQFCNPCADTTIRSRETYDKLVNQSLSRSPSED